MPTISFTGEGRDRMIGAFVRSMNHERIKRLSGRKEAGGL